MKEKNSMIKKGIALILGSICVMCIISNTSKMYVNAENVTVKEIMVTFAPSLNKGDVNLDGKVDLTDAQLALNAALKIVKLSPEAVAQGDINGNGVIDQSDAQSILRMALAIQ